MNNSKLPTPKLVLFREVLDGDLRKFDNNSNDSDTGGGARDLRFRITRQPEIKECLDIMFERLESDGRLAEKNVCWTSQATKHSTKVEYWQPTDARPGELRISTISKIDSWFVSKDRFEEAKVQGNYLFYLLILDAENNLWARTFNSKNLEGNDLAFKNAINEALNSTGTKQGVIKLNTIDNQ